MALGAGAVDGARFRRAGEPWISAIRQERGDLDEEQALDFRREALQVRLPHSRD
jgi:hypothetical protein